MMWRPLGVLLQADGRRPACWRGAIAAGLLAGLLAIATTVTHAAEAGWRSFTVRGVKTDAVTTDVALWYPTSATPRVMPMGPFEVRAAIAAVPEQRFAGVVVISHGLGGSEFAHGRLAEALARQGWLVAALRHPRDNWQDMSLIKGPSAEYFDTRPRQISRVLDALLSDPDLSARIARDSGGPRIAAIGHSAGGYSVLALAGGKPDVSRIARHCREQAAADPLFCTNGPRASPATAATLPDLRDPRVRAAVALAPVGVVFDPASLAAIRIPVAVHVPMADRWLPPRFHGEAVASLIPGSTLERVPNAWHFAYIDRPSTPIPTPDGDIGADPAGFDRAAFLAALGPRLAVFLDAAMAQTAAPR